MQGILAKQAHIDTGGGIMKTERLEVTGMTCSGCAGKVTRVLEELDGVSDVNVSLAAGEATVQFDERLASFDQLESAVKRAGYGVGGAPAIHSHEGKAGRG
jgi:copper chaperone CopZ